MRSGRAALLRGAALVGVLVLLAVLGAWILQSSIPRTIVIASGPQDSLLPGLAQRYREILARHGVTLDERRTGGAAENARLVADPGSGVDVAFMQGGVIRDPGRVVMLAALSYEPLWVFYRGTGTLTRLDELRHRSIAIGTPEQGVRAFVEPLLKANDVTAFNSKLEPLGNLDALHALQQGRVDAAMFVGAVESPSIFQALRDRSLKLMSFTRAEAYQRRFDHVTRLTLPAGAVDFALDIPAADVELISTESMLVARDDLPAAIVNLLHEAAREAHADQGYFEKPREFPNTDPVDIPVSVDADRHHRFGPSLLHRYLPFFFATFVERLIVLLVPLLVVIVPLVNLLPQLLRWRMRSRIYRWYGELTLLERDVASRTGKLPIEEWLTTLDRIAAGAARIRTPTSYASEAFTLREHIALVRRNVMAKAREGRDVELSVS
jgi:TRAP-type uncharacterized transport system substrate-binding protein